MENKYKDIEEYFKGIENLSDKVKIEARLSMINELLESGMINYIEAQELTKLAFED